MRDKKTVLQQPPQRHMGVYVGICLALVFLYLFLSRLAPVRVGDGSEYYAMYLAWRDTLRPWMNPASFASYQQLYSEHGIADLVTIDWLQTAFPALQLGDMADFNHFWFYSFLAFLVSKTVSVTGLVLVPHQAFLALHWLLLCITGITAYRLYGKRGIGVFAVLTFFSPMLWFTDKVHTEVLTYCLTLMGIMFVFSRLYLAAALVIGIAATQNPSFALVAFIPFAYRFVLLRTQRFTFFEVCLVVATAFAVLAHPVYYFLRFGVVTPQLLAGGASLGSNLSTFYIWIIDPDLGLLPNWPVGVFFILTAMALVKWAKPEVGEGGNRAFYVFLAAFFLINFYAHSSTINLNSAGTPGVARYSLWYLPAFFPVVYFVARCLPFGRWATALWTLVLLALGVYGIQQNDPVKPEQYSSPSWLSSVIQTNVPGLYYPPAEVFTERYSGYGEAIKVLKPRAVLGPDCHKLFVFAGQRERIVTAPSSCALDLTKLENLVGTDFGNVTEDQYVHLSQAQLDATAFIMAPGTYQVGTSGNGTPVIGEGWFAIEPWGRWSSADATLVLPCNRAQPYAGKESIDLVLQVEKFADQPVQIRQGETILFDGPVPADNSIPITVKVDSCKTSMLTLNLHVEDAKSALERGVSEDPRTLGVGLRGVEVLR